MNPSMKTYVACHTGMVGSALCRVLAHAGYQNVVTRTHAELDLTRQEAVEEFFYQHHFDRVYLAAANVGGVFANDVYPADFIYDNLMIACNVIRAAHDTGVGRLLALGSSCIYPKLAPQPISEDALLTGRLEPTNEPYAVAKIATFKLCESYYRQFGADFRTVMPTSLYGPNDNFHPENSHVIPALMRRLHEAARNKKPSVTIWGSGNPMREFMHVDDLAAACIYIMEMDTSLYREKTKPLSSHINIGTGKDCSIRELAESLCRIVGYDGKLEFDVTKPDGTPRKLLDVTLLHDLGWRESIPFDEGLRETYHWFLNHVVN